MAEYARHTDVHVLTGQIMKSSGDKFCRGLSANKSSGRQIVTIQIILSTMSTASRQSHDGVVRLPLDESDKLFIQLMDEMGNTELIHQFKRSNREVREIMKMVQNASTARNRSECEPDSLVGREVTQVSPSGKSNPNQNDMSSIEEGSTVLADTHPNWAGTQSETDSNIQRTADAPNGGEGVEVVVPDIVVQRFEQSNGGRKSMNMSAPNNASIITAAEILWEYTKFTQHDDWVFRGKYCKRIGKRLNLVFKEDDWNTWRDRVKKQFNRKRTAVTQQVKDEYIGK